MAEIFIVRESYEDFVSWLEKQVPVISERNSSEHSEWLVIGSALHDGRGRLIPLQGHHRISLWAGDIDRPYEEVSQKDYSDVNDPVTAEDHQIQLDLENIEGGAMKLTVLPGYWIYHYNLREHVFQDLVRDLGERYGNPIVTEAKGELPTVTQTGGQPRIKHPSGRTRISANDWAYEESEKGRSNNDIYPDWLERRKLEAGEDSFPVDELQDLRSLLKNAIAYRRKRAQIQKAGEK